MAQLCKLQVQGVRSIDPRFPHVIQFQDPLTIITGPNGSGKTTLIEALNYITTDTKPTGQYPSFIHNLEICGLNRVDAKIMLEFKTANGKLATAVRRLNLTKGKNGKPNGKQDESNITTEDKFGNKVQISSKSADFKAEMQHLFDVPRAILTNVVFCHQENSTWPLSEPKIVKSKFDAIFELTRYVKIVERLTKQAKDAGERLKSVVSKELMALEMRYDEFCSKKTNHEEQTEALKSMDGVIEAKERMRAKAEQQIRDIDEQQKRLKEFQMKEALLNSNINSCEEQLNLCKVPDFNGAVDELEAEIAEIERSAEFQNFACARKHVDSAILKVTQERSAYVIEKRAIEDQKVKLLAMAEQVIQCEREIAAFESSLRQEYNIQTADNLLKWLQNLFSSLENELQSMKTSQQVKITAAEEAQSAAAMKSQEVILTIKSKKEMYDKCIKELESMKIKRSDAMLGQHELQTLQTKILAAESEFTKCGVVDTNAVNENEQQRNELQKELTLLRAEFESKSAQFENQRQIQRLRDECEQKDRRLFEFKKQHMENFKLLKCAPFTFPIGSRIAEEAESLRQSFVELEKKISAHKSVKSNAEATIDSLRKKVTDLETKKIALRDSVKESDDLDKLLSIVRERLTDAKHESGSVEGVAALYRQFSSEAKSSLSCPLCLRGFRSSTDVTSLAERLEKMSIDSPALRAQFQQTITKLEARERQLLEYKASFQQIEEIDEMLSKIQSSIVSETSRMEVAQKQFEELSPSLKDLSAKQAAATKIQIDAALMDSLYTEIRDLRISLENLQVDVDFSQGSNEAVSADELNSLKALVSSMASKLDELHTEGTRMFQIVNQRNRLSEELSKLQARRLELGDGAANLANIQQQISEKEVEVNFLQTEITNLKKLLPDARMEEANTKQFFKEIQLAARNAEDELRKRMVKFEQYLRDYERLQKTHQNLKIDDAESQRLEAECQRIESQIAATHRREEELLGQLTNVSKISERRSILETQRAKMVIVQRLEKLCKERSKLGAWTGETQERLDHKHKEAKDIIDKANRDIGTEKGRRHEIERTIEMLARELKEKRYANAYNDLKAKLIERRVLKSLKEDLEKYATQTESTILEFHRMKMEAVNEILGNLWRRVYRGTDIESIRIKAETSGSGVRSKYDYNVMMVLENGVEIEMRDRCSAGQKMLASILIRLALSEVFGSKCAIMTLDEPTTNLDVQKIDDMADMLIEVIKARSTTQQIISGRPIKCNFQIVVITHDERFVSVLRRHLRPEIIFHVAKDEFGRSKLSQERVGEDV